MRDPPNKALKSLTAIAALGVVGVAGFVLRDRAESAVDVMPSAAPSVPPRVAGADAPAEPPAIVKLRELQAMSETYRNTTFLIAIRDAGFVCHVLLGVHGGFDAAMAWTAACSDMLAYTVRIASSGALAVEPLATYFDGVAPRVDQQQPLPEPQ